jgi:hypothetical protein
VFESAILSTWLNAKNGTPLKTPRVTPDEVTKDRLVADFPELVKIVDEGNLRYYAAARWGSAQDNDWCSPALVKRLRLAVKNATPAAKEEPAKS